MGDSIDYIDCVKHHCTHYKHVKSISSTKKKLKQVKPKFQLEILDSCKYVKAPESGVEDYYDENSYCIV